MSSQLRGLSFVNNERVLAYTPNSARYINENGEVSPVKQTSALNRGWLFATHFNTQPIRLSVDVRSKMRLDDLVSGMTVAEFEMPMDSYMSAGGAISDDERRVAAWRAGHLVVWDVPSSKPVFQYPQTSEKWRFISGDLSKDGRQLFVTKNPASSGAFRPHLETWDVEAGEMLHSITYPDPAIWIQALDNGQVLLLGHRGHLHQVNPGDGSLVAMSLPLGRVTHSSSLPWRFVRPRDDRWLAIPQPQGHVLVMLP